MGRIASFHLARERHAAVALARLAADRPRLARTPGLAFWRVLGTGRGRATAPSVDAHRTALFAVWDDDAALDRFLASTPAARRRVGAAEHWHVRLRALSGHGAWAGFPVLAGLERGVAAGPVAVITRAAVRPLAWAEFHRAARTVDAELARAPGLLAVVGIGEAPVGRLGTFSLWRSSADVDAFGHRMPDHGAVVRRTRAERWYGEELFARFAPYASSGTWDGRDPAA